MSKFTEEELKEIMEEVKQIEGEIDKHRNHWDIEIIVMGVIQKRAIEKGIADIAKSIKEVS